MPKSNPQAAIVRFFENAPIDVAEAIFNVVRDVIKRRPRAVVEGATPIIKKKRGRPKGATRSRGTPGAEPPTNIQVAG